MKHAFLDNKPILLQPETYNRIPFWRMAARQDQIRCPVCAFPLRLIAGVTFEPYFAHAEDVDCSGLSLEEASGPEWLLVQEQVAAATAVVDKPEEVETTEDPMIGSFRMPKKRSIGKSATVPSPAPKPPIFRKRLTPKKSIQHLAEQKRNESLHPGQQQAVHTTEGPLLILAGAGSGKTRVMTARTAHLIQDKGIEPKQILVVTFTTKAAEEIRQRIARQLLPSQARELVAGTFHSIFYRMLLHHQPARWDQQRLLKKEWQKWRLLRETGVLLGHDDLLALKENEALDALGVISRWKNEYLLPHDVAYREPESDTEKQAQQLYPLYEEAKRKHNWFDFDDMLIGCYEMLREDSTLLKRYQDRITHVMIDEFQDINRIQYETVKLLAAPHNNLCVIGDDDQSIYGFRGSDPQYILGFTKDFPEAQTITLEVNYRSHSSIVSLGYSLIGHNRERWEKECRSFHHEEGDAYLFEPEDEEEQASRIVDEIIHRQEQGALLGECAILYRTNESARPILERLSEAGIPFHYTQEEDSFYQRQTVRWTLAYLRLAQNPDDSDALKEVLPTLYISHEMWNALRSQAILEDVPILHVLPNQAQLKPYQRKHLQTVMDILTSCREGSAAQALELIYEDGKLRDYLKKRAKNREDGKDRWADELQQLLAASKRHATVADFLTYIDQMTQREKEWRTQRPLPEEAVHVLSIHRAKGLEYDHVFLPDLVEGALPHEYTLDELRKGGNAALEEERRLLYVAITRARHSLCIGIPRERFGRKTRISRFVAEMGR
ncbi:ATP-dependent helicase [Brevibacillus centrosporus]|uniref:UvrD-helicase domain-containing protein n=1 Tax=Brevibacillus centrosporus TaxID=54910 RepID=UPI000F0A25FF|nr:ATP-dependent helicase [Brevibacillus centrosporus]MEC2131909.1 ATP-dependent helicase [Brevibacillus centrosporus]RNB64052.1 ATP-dependent helicase [Brevibacillus centrosporus]GED34186.1 putative ATP-dependent DNA helicase YjcD [Brevibacillus centrosporus]